MNEINKDVNLNIRIEKSMKEDLEKLAKADDRGLSDYIRLIFKKLILKKGKI